MPTYESGTDLVYTTSSKTTKGKHKFGDGATPAAVVDEVNNRLGIQHGAPTKDLGLGGDANRSAGLERGTAAATAGKNLTLSAGAPKAGETDLAGGTLFLSGGTSTGSGESAIELQVAKAGGSGTADRAPETIVKIHDGGADLDGDIDFGLLMERRSAAGAGKTMTLEAGKPKTAETNTAGGDLLLKAGIGTGNAAGGKITGKTSPPGGSGTTDQTLQTVFEADNKGNMQTGLPSLAQGATDGFLYIPTVAAAPSGTPTAKTGFVPICFCPADNKIYVYDGGWLGVALT